MRPRLRGPTPFPACLWLPPAHGCAPAGHRTQCGRLRPSRGRRRPRGREKPCGRAGAGPGRRRPRRRQGGRAPLGCTHVGPLWGRPTAEPLRSGAGHRRSARRQTSTRRYCHVLAQHTLQPAFPTPTPTPASGPRAPGLPPAARLGSSPPRMAAGCRLRGAPGLGLLLCATAQGPDRGAPGAACGEPLQGHGECRGRQPPTPVEDGCPGAGAGEQPPRGWTWTLVASLSGTCSPDRQPTVRGGRTEPCGLSTLPAGLGREPAHPGAAGTSSPAHGKGRTCLAGRGQLAGKDSEGRDAETRLPTGRPCPPTLRARPRAPQTTPRGRACLELSRVMELGCDLASAASSPLGAGTWAGSQGGREADPAVQMAWTDPRLQNQGTARRTRSSPSRDVWHAAQASPQPRPPPHAPPHTPCSTRRGRLP